MIHGTSNAFVIRDCALIKIGTGVHARDLREFRSQLETIHPACIYFHFWGTLLRPRFEHPLYPNDFAEWAHHGLHDKRLAERLGVIDPADFNDTEALRQELAGVVDQRLDETESVPAATRDSPFNWIGSSIVVFATPGRIAHPRETAAALQTMTLSSVFYHFIDARRRHPESIDDFRRWLQCFDHEYQSLAERIAHIDPYFTSLHDLRHELLNTFQGFFEEKRA